MSLTRIRLIFSRTEAPKKRLSPCDPCIELCIARKGAVQKIEAGSRTRSAELNQDRFEVQFRSHGVRRSRTEHQRKCHCLGKPIWRNLIEVEFENAGVGRLVCRARDNENIDLLNYLYRFNNTFISELQQGGPEIHDVDY